MVRHGVGTPAVDICRSENCACRCPTQAPAGRIRVSEPRVSERQPRSLVVSGKEGSPLLWIGTTQERDHYTVLRDKRPGLATSR